MRNLLDNKKGAEMTIGTIIVIILALVVLVFLIFSFTKTGGSLMDNVKNFFGGGSNIDSIKNACQTACITKSSYEYNDVIREIRWDTKTKAMASCKELEVGKVAKCATPDGKVILTPTTNSDQTPEQNCLDMNKQFKWNTNDKAKPVCELNGELKSDILSESQCKAVWFPAFSKIEGIACSEI